MEGKYVVVIGIHLHCLAVEAGFYSDAVECRTLNPADQVRSRVVAVECFSSVTLKFLYMVYGLDQCVDELVNFRANSAKY